MKNKIKLKITCVCKNSSVDQDTKLKKDEYLIQDVNDPNGFIFKLNYYKNYGWDIPIPINNTRYKSRDYFIDLQLVFTSLFNNEDYHIPMLPQYLKKLKVGESDLLVLTRDDNNHVSITQTFDDRYRII